jgi:hypothetical protein
MAGLATGLVATGRVPHADATAANKVLRVDVHGVRRDLAVVDVSVSSERWVGARAIWHPEALQQIFVAFTESGAVGLSSIAGLLHPVSREAKFGVRIDLAPLAEAATVVMAPLAPGLVLPVGICGVHEIHLGEPQPVRSRRGVIALDGERELEFLDTDRITICLDIGGPLTIDLDRVMGRAARDGLLVRPIMETAGRT